MRTGGGADDLNVVLDTDSSLGLQHQLRRKLIDAINRGVLRPGSRLPSSRALADRIGVSRNTVALAYEALLSEGHLVSRARSGVFVAPDAPAGRVATSRRAPVHNTVILARLGPKSPEDGRFRCPPNWHQYPYPFIDGRIEPEMLPLREWREAMRLACSRPNALAWSGGAGEADDAPLLEEIRSKVLPGRGVEAGADEVMLTLSARQGLQLALDLLVDRSTPVVFETPADPEVHRRACDLQAQVLTISSGQSVPMSLPRGSVVIASARSCSSSSGSYRERTQALMQATVECGGILIEQDRPAELRQGQRVAPAMRALDSTGRIVYITELSAVAAPGSVPGIIVAEPRFIERLRDLRHQLGAEIPGVYQRAWAYFIGLGHYAAAMARSSRVLAERHRELRDALNHYLHKFVRIESHPGSSAYWVRGTAGLNVSELAREAAALGILIEPVRTDGQADAFCMGVTSIPKERIRAGVFSLSRLIRWDPARGARRLTDEAAAPLTGAALRQAIAGATLLYNTVYGDPCTIEVRRNGELAGRAGYANEDCDVGRWWVEGDRWFRQWQQWAYAECSGYSVIIEGDQLRWYGEDGVLADTAVIIRGSHKREPRH